MTALRLLKIAIMEYNEEVKSNFELVKCSPKKIHITNQIARADSLPCYCCAYSYQKKLH